MFTSIFFFELYKRVVVKRSCYNITIRYANNSWFSRFGQEFSISLYYPNKPSYTCDYVQSVEFRDVTGLDRDGMATAQILSFHHPPLCPAPTPETASYTDMSLYIPEGALSTRGIVRQTSGSVSFHPNFLRVLNSKNIYGKRSAYSQWASESFVESDETWEWISVRNIYSLTSHVHLPAYTLTYGLVQGLKDQCNT